MLNYSVAELRIFTTDKEKFNIANVAFRYTEAVAINFKNSATH